MSDDQARHRQAGYYVLDPLGTGSRRVLLLGNSHVRYHSLGAMIERLAPPGFALETIGLDGATLASHWQARRLEAVEPPEVLVLQDRSVAALDAPEAHLAWVARYCAWAEAHDLRCIVQVHWARAPWCETYRSHPHWAADHAEAFAKLSDVASSLRERGIEVAPLHEAFARALEHMPATRLFYRGGNHAHVSGAYLAACVYARLLGADSLRWRCPYVERAELLWTIARDLVEVA